MRLIDADALKGLLRAGWTGPIDWKKLTQYIDAAPTIACERCEHDTYPKYCGAAVTWGEWDSDKSTVSCDMPVSACSNFKERT